MRYALLLALLLFPAALAQISCPLTPSQVNPFIPPASALLPACSNAPGTGCPDSCLCVLGNAARVAQAAANVSETYWTKDQWQACVLQSLSVFYDRGLATNDLLRLSSCSFTPASEPACLLVPLNPTLPPAPPPSPPAAVDPPVARRIDAFWAVLISTLCAAFVCQLAVAKLSLSAGASSALSPDDYGVATFSRLDFVSVHCVARRPLHARLAPRKVGDGGGVILEGVDVSLSRGSFCAVVGPSGSGKSTLLHIIAGELVLGAPAGGALSASGCVCVDGAPATSAAALAGLRRAIGFVAQDDVLLPSLTVREAVHFSAALRLPPGTTARAVDSAVDSVLRALDLEKVAARRVGGANSARGVSGGERRRVSIAQELVVTRGGLGGGALVLDEATSGLDSSTAGALVSTLAQLAREGGTMVVASLHQPSGRMLPLFSHIVCLSAGRTLWQGPPGELRGALERAHLPPAAEENLIDALLDVAAGAAEADCARLRAQVAPPAAAAERPPMAAAATDAPKPPSPLRWLAQEARVLLWRERLHFARSPALLVTHLGVALLLSLWIGWVYYDVQPSLAGFQNRAGAAFFALISFGFAAVSALELFVCGRPLLRKEAYRYYSPVSWFAVVLFMDLICLRVAPACVYACLFYFISGWQKRVVRFLRFLAALILTSVSTSALTTLVAMAVPNQAVGFVLMSFLLLQMAVFGGFLTNTSTLPPAISWLRYTSLIFYGFESMICNELAGLALDFSVSGLADVRAVDGSRFLAALNLSPSAVDRDLVSLACLFAFYASAAAMLHMLRTAPPGGFARRRAAKRGAKAIALEAPAEKGSQLGDAEQGAASEAA